jgi:hypothetical protein
VHNHDDNSVCFSASTRAIENNSLSFILLSEQTGADNRFPHFGNLAEPHNGCSTWIPTPADVNSSSTIIPPYELPDVHPSQISFSVAQFHDFRALIVHDFSTLGTPIDEVSPFLIDVKATSTIIPLSSAHSCPMILSSVSIELLHSGMNENKIPHFGRPSVLISLFPSVPFLNFNDCGFTVPSIENHTSSNIFGSGNPLSETDGSCFHTSKVIPLLDSSLSLPLQVAEDCGNNFLISGQFDRDFSPARVPTSEFLVSQLPDLNAVPGHVPVSEFPQIENCYTLFLGSQLPDLNSMSNHVPVSEFPQTKDCSTHFPASELQDANSLPIYVSISDFPQTEFCNTPLPTSELPDINSLLIPVPIPEFPQTEIVAHVCPLLNSKMRIPYQFLFQYLISRR